MAFAIHIIVTKIRIQFESSCDRRCVLRPLNAVRMVAMKMKGRNLLKLGSKMVVGGVLFVSMLLTRVFAEPFVAGFDRFHREATASNLEAGRLLLTELNCTACHTVEKALSPKGGPQLKGVGSRLERDWLAKYLRSPHETKPGGTMPEFLHLVPVEEQTRAVQGLVEYLSTDETEEPKIVASGSNPVAHEFWLKGDAAKGQTKYHQVGCVACHAIDEAVQPPKSGKSDLEKKIAALDLEPEELTELGLSLPKKVRPVPMSDISSKYSLRSLSMFLLAPQLSRPAGRMPNLKLQPHEAADIAAYLFSSKTHSKNTTGIFLRSGKVNASGSDPVVTGRMYFEKLACVNCHEMKKLKPKPAKSLMDLDVKGEVRGCLADDVKGPRFGLDEQQNVALIEAIRSIQSKGLESVRADESTASWAMLQANCYACHERSGRGGVGPDQVAFFENLQQVDIGDEGRLPPPLDMVGKKLQRPWLEKVFEGKGDVRPHFLARMPIFQEPAKSLAKVLADEDTMRLVTKLRSDDGEGVQADLNAGRDLLDAGCIQCHAFRGESLPGTIGVDISDVEKRLNQGWFRAFLLNPAALKKNTRMPSFFPDGKSSQPHILNGSVPHQIESLWKYLNDPSQPLPSKLEQSRSQSFELVPGDKPVVLRTFMEADSAGTNAIAVGFPQQVNFAWDADRLALSEIWIGKFLNAQGTWFDRFAPPAIPLGSTRHPLSRSSYGHLDENQKFQPLDEMILRFVGYLLDAKGTPTFRYFVNEIEVEERLEVVGPNELVREWKFSSSGSNAATSPQVWLSLSDSVSATQTVDVFRTLNRLEIRAPEGAETRLITNGENLRLLWAVPKGAGTYRVSYRWE
jgi:mono/diheme cytochrome c family protein